MTNRRPYCQHARLDTDPDDGRGCPSCEIEARWPAAAAYNRAKRREARVRGVLRFAAPYVIIVVALIGLGLFTRVVGAS